MATTNRNARRYLRIHLRAYAAAAVPFVIVNLVAAGGGWFFWPVVVWGVFVIVHYMYVKSLTIDNGWAQRRARDVTGKAYDAGHIEDIHKRYRDNRVAGRGSEPRTTKTR